MNDAFYPEDAKFYYKKISGNKTLYRLIVNDKVVARSNIPKSILKDIKSLDELNLDNSGKVNDLLSEIETYQKCIQAFKQYIVKLEDDIANMETEDIPEGDPRNYYYKRKLNGIKPIIYSYRGYVSSEDAQLKKGLVGDTIKCSSTGKCTKAYPSDDIIDDIGPFDSYYTFLGKQADIKLSLASIEELKKKMASITEEVDKLEASSGKLKKEDIITEYYELLRKHKDKNAGEKVYNDFSEKMKYTFWTPFDEEKIREQVRMKLEADKRRAEMLKERLEEERRKREQMVKTEPYVSPSDLLRSLGIVDKASWKKWLVKNHPDRAGEKNNKICQQVIDAGRKIGY